MSDDDDRLANLTPRELKVLRERFGVEPDGITLEELGTQFEATRARIREIERKALSRRRNGDDPDDAA